MFEEFINRIAQQLKEKLPGEEAQHKMSPKGRKTTSHYLSTNPNPKRSAVLILIYQHQSNPHIVFILRPSYEGTHSGQVAFPGGKVEEGDTSLQDAALRETEEEIGVNRNTVKLLGALTPLYIPVSNFLVHPFVGSVSAKPRFAPDPNEVEQIIEVSLSEITDDRLVKNKTILIKSVNLEIETPYFDLGGHTVWGATAMILSELKEVLRKA